MKKAKSPKDQKERRLVTILFADLSGFTAFSQTLDPEELSDAINVCFEQLNRIITKHGGTIHKYEGDSVIAIFGLPHAHEDDPERGIKATLEMMDYMPEINKILSSKLKTACDLGLHAGINLGTVFAGEIGSKEKKEYTIIGEAVNLASRLKDTAERDEILVSGRIFRQTRYLFEYKPLQPITVKGISKPVRIYKPIKIKKKPDPKRGVEGLYSLLVGREKEFKLLCKEIETLHKQKKGGIVYILGEAGIGKSRLLEELKSHITSKKIPITVLEGHCLSYGETLTYFPILEILKQLLNITDQDSAETIQNNILNKITALLPDTFKEIVPYIGYLFSIPLPLEFEEKIKYLDAENLKLRIFVALKNLLVSSSLKKPILMIVEDYHWIDTASLEFLKFFLGVPESIPPLLILCPSRAEKESEGYRLKEHLKEQLGDRFNQVKLQPLSIEVTQQLADNLLTLSGLPSDIKGDILSKADGNPFYLEEILRSLIDHGYLVNESGVWKTTPQFSMSDIPDTIQGIIVARLDRLESDLKNLLQQAAVIGRSFLIHILERLTNITSLMMSLHLATLEEFEYIRLLTKDPELEYIFKHPLVQEVAYNSLPKKYRKQLHRQVAEIIEKLLHHRLDEFTEILAHHYAHSDAYDKAVEWLKKAGVRAKERYANEEAIKYFQKLISILDELKDSSPSSLLSQQKAYEALGDIHSLKGAYAEAIENYDAMFKISKDILSQATAKRKKANVYTHQSKFDDALQILDDAKKMIKDKSPQVVLEQAEIYQLRGSIYEVKGLTSEAQKEIETALGLIEKVKPSNQLKMVKAYGFSNLGGVFRSRGDYDKAIEMYNKSRTLLQELHNKRGIANTTYQLGIVYHLKGDYQKAIEFNKQGLVILEEIGDKKGIAHTSGNLGIMYSYLGDYAKALEYHQKNLTISEEIGDQRGVGMASSNLAKLYLMDGNPTKAQVHFQKYLDISEEIGDKVGTSAALGNLAILFLRTNKLDKAEEYLLRSEQILKELGNKQLLIIAYTHLAEVQLQRKVSFKKALEFTKKGWSLAEEIGSKPGKADCFLMYSKIYAAKKEFPKAEENLNNAIKLFTEVGRMRTVISAYHEYGQILNDVGQTKKAQMYIKKAKEIDQQLKHK
jgi:class 3 adenylate cyclase/tetratricopeptide (TPR) repeat protein